MSDNILISKQDANQVLRLAYDDASKSLRTQSTGSPNGQPAPDTSVVVGGVDPSGNTEPVNLDASGNLKVTFSGDVAVVQPDGSLLHVTVDTSALPAGAATEAKQDTGNEFLSNIETYTSNIDTSTENTSNYISDVVNHASSFSVESLTTEGTPGQPIPQKAVVVAAQDLSGNTQTLKVDGNQSLYTIVAGSVLPSGAATESTLSAFATKSASAAVTEAFDEQVIAYVGATTDINTVTYKLAGTTVATLTMSYDGSNRLVGVVKT
jgi:hypothetical protein